MNTVLVAVLTVFTLSRAAPQFGITWPPLGLDFPPLLPGCSKIDDMGLNPLNLIVPGDIWETDPEGRSQLWPKGIIPYCIDPTQFNETQRANIKQYFDDLNLRLVGCVTWRPCTKYDTDYVYIISGTGCWTQTIGRAGGRMYMNFEGWCVTEKICQHEAGHAMGLPHTQCRYDRDKYITINSANMKSGCDAQYAIYKGPTTGVYEYASNMHYGARACSANGQPVMVPKDPSVPLSQLGSASKMTDEDIRQIKSLYNCKL